MEVGDGGTGREEMSSAAAAEQLQVMAFTTRGELGQFASKLQLTRTPLAELKPDSSLGDTYAGGKVLSIFSAELTQGSVVVLLQDNPRSAKYVQCVLSGDVTRLLPRSGQLGSSEVYVHGGRVQPITAESSQEMDLEIRVEGEHERIWIVNRDAGRDGFLPSRLPSEFQGRGGNARKARRQRHMEAGLERERTAANKTTGAPPTTSASSGPTSVNVSPTTAISTASINNSAQPGPSSCDTATHYAAGPEPPPSDGRITVPNSSNTPASLQGAHSRVQTLPDGGSGGETEGMDVEEGEEEEGERGGSHSSMEMSSSSESEDEGQGMGEGNRQDGSLFSHRKNTREQQRYAYRKLADLEAGLEKVYVVGVVTDFQPPFQTKGRDFCSIVNIMDESVREPLKCTFFHSNQDKLPKVGKVGEIVIFHRINIKLFPSGIQGIGLSFTSSLSFVGRLGAKVKPRTGSVSYTFTAGDRKRVKELRLWAAGRCRTSSPSLRALREITVGSATSVDLVCQVLSVALGPGAPDCHTAVLCVWDGTQPRHRSLKLDLSTFNTTSVDTELLEVASSCSEHVVVYGRDLVQEVVNLMPGQFACLQNIQVKEHMSQRNEFKDVFSAVELRLEPTQSSCGRKSVLKVLSPADIEVFELRKVLKSHRKRRTVFFRSLPPDIVLSSITDTPPHSRQQPIPLRALASCTATPAKFRCVVKVLGIEPCCVEELVQLCCPVCKHKVPVTNTSTNSNCSVCLKTQKKKKKKVTPRKLSPVYFFKLLAADETGHITVYASGDQAAKFLAGFPPAVFYQEPQQRMALLQSLYRLTGGNDPFDHNSVTYVRPWVAMCLVSMLSGGISAPTAGTVTYHLFDTVLNTE